MRKNIRYVALLLLTVATDGFAQSGPTSAAPDVIRIAPMSPPPVAPRSKAPPPQPQATCHLNYYGGPVLENVVVYQVDWGTGVDSTVDNNIGAFYQYVTNSAYFDWLSEYNTVGLNGFSDGLPGSNQGISHGSFGGRYVITPSVTSTTITDTDIQNELAAQINAGNLPHPSYSADGQLNTLYMFEFPYGITIDQGGGSLSCVVFCAYHGTMMYNGKPLAYGVHPDMMNPSSGCYIGCGSDPTQFNNVTSVHSHELIESVTDTDVGLTPTVQRPLAWYSTTRNCGEIGDICNAQQGTIGSYVVQKEWSNKVGQCIVTNPSLPPICTGPSTPAGCRICTAADNGFACNGATPYCETDKTNVKYGACVACTSSAQCSGATPICGKSSTASADDVCRGCTASDCSGAKPACETSGSFAGQCVQCTSGNATACSGTTPVCNTATDSCVQCNTPNDCSAGGQCQVAACNANKCGYSNATNGTSCTGSNKCYGSYSCQNGTCTGASPVVCTASDQCHTAGTCDPTTGACSNPTASNGTACTGSNKCFGSYSCQSGACTGASPVVCTASDQCHTAGSCDPTTGACSNPAAPDGTTCTNSNKCFGSYSCQSGACAGASPVVCTASDQCHVAGSCDPTSGACSNPAAPDGTTCDDHNACTAGDSCQSGSCSGGATVMCPPGDECNTPAACSTATGCGSVTPKPDGTPCSNGLCMAGVCAAASMNMPDMAGVGAAGDMASGGTPGDLAMGGGGSSDDMAGSGATGGGSGSGGGGSGGAGSPGGKGGCSCDVTHDAPTPWGTLLGLGALVLLRRRRRASTAAI